MSDIAKVIALSLKTYINDLIVLDRYNDCSNKNTEAENVPCCEELEAYTCSKQGKVCIRIYFGERNIFFQSIDLYSVSISRSGNSSLFPAAVGSILFISRSSGIAKRVLLGLIWS
jgi:hypothetical protein